MKIDLCTSALCWPRELSVRMMCMSAKIEWLLTFEMKWHQKFQVWSFHREFSLLAEVTRYNTTMDMFLVPSNLILKFLPEVTVTSESSEELVAWVNCYKKKDGITFLLCSSPVGILTGVLHALSLTRCWPCSPHRALHRMTAAFWGMFLTSSC